MYIELAIALTRFHVELFSGDLELLFSSYPSHDGNAFDFKRFATALYPLEAYDNADHTSHHLYSHILLTDAVGLLALMLLSFVMTNSGVNNATHQLVGGRSIGKYVIISTRAASLMPL
jgi:hypothetical protein